MRASTAFFAGVGTVAIAIGAGLGGGLTIANMMSPLEPKLAMGKAERRGAPELPPSTRDPLVPVPYLAATQASTKAAFVVAPAERRSPQPQTDAGNSSPQPSRPSETTASNEQASKPFDPPKPAASAKPSDAATSKPSAPSVQQVVTHEQASAPDDTNAKSRDPDVKRDADLKRAERRKAERRQQWADRRRIEQSREQEPRDVESSVREDSELRVDHEDGEQPVRIGFPQIRLFGPE
jgi:hypothetical protein